MVGIKDDGKVNQQTLDKMREAAVKGWTITDNILELNPNLVQKDHNDYIKPVYGGNKTDSFNTRGGTHKGVDIGGISGSLNNIPLYAVDDGYIVYIRRDEPNNPNAKAGNYLILQGDEGMSFRYLHMNGFNDELEKAGPSLYNGVKIKVRKGDFIGYVGNTGVGTGPHLHFEVYNNKYGTNANDYGPYRENLENYIDLD